MYQAHNRSLSKNNYTVPALHSQVWMVLRFDVWRILWAIKNWSMKKNIIKLVQFFYKTKISVFQSAGSYVCFETSKMNYIFRMNMCDNVHKSLSFCIIRLEKLIYKFVEWIKLLLTNCQ